MSQRDTHADSGPHTYGYAQHDANPKRNANGNTNCHGYCNGDAKRHTKNYSNSQTQTNSKGATDSGELKKGGGA